MYVVTLYGSDKWCHFSDFIDKIACLSNLLVGFEVHRIKSFTKFHPDVCMIVKWLIFLSVRLNFQKHFTKYDNLQTESKKNKKSWLRTTLSEIPLRRALLRE